MNDKRLRIYLDDHLAIIFGEMELANRVRSSNRGTPLGDFLDRLAADVKDQQSVLKDVIRQVGGKESLVKKGAAWFAEKLGRLKLNDSLLTYSNLSRVIELETLSAAAQERISLWDNLDAVVRDYGRLAVFKFSILRDQSEQHLEELNTRRRYAAAQAFVDNDSE